MDDEGGDMIARGSFRNGGGRRDALPSSGDLSPLANAHTPSQTYWGKITSKRPDDDQRNLELIAYQLGLSVRQLQQAIRLGVIEWPKR